MGRRKARTKIVDGIIQKLCGSCKEFKILEDFHIKRNNQSGHSSWCKKCFSEYMKVKNSNKEYVRNKWLKTAYGITIEDYDKLYTNQNGKCAICKNNFDLLMVDHEHSSGKIRGLLCDDCNQGIGRFKDNIDILKSAIFYLIESW